MVSIWWVACAFVSGGLAGLLIYAFMSMSAEQGERTLRADEELQRRAVDKLDLEEHWIT